MSLLLYRYCIMHPSYLLFPNGMVDTTIVWYIKLLPRILESYGNVTVGCSNFYIIICH